MKKIKYLLLLGLFAIITTGCVKFNANMDIKKDKSMEFSVIYAFDKSLMGEGNGIKEEDMAGPKACGFEVTKYSEGNYEGFKLVKRIANIDEVSSETDVTYSLSGMTEEGSCNGKIFKVVKGTDKNTYTAKLTFEADSSSMTEEENEELTIDEVTPDEDTTLDAENDFEITSNSNDMDLSAFMKNLDLTFSVNLPYGAVSSNATTKENDNKKLTWKLSATEAQNIEFTFEIKNNEGNNMMLYIAVGAGVLIFIVLLILVISRMKKNKAPVEPVTIEPVVEPTTPVAPQEPVAPAEANTAVDEPIVPKE